MKPRKIKLLIGIAMVLTGLFMVVFGNVWGSVVFELTAGSEWGAWLEHFVPFFPMLVIGTGAALYVSDRRARKPG